MVGINLVHLICYIPLQRMPAPHVLANNTCNLNVLTFGMESGETANAFAERALHGQRMSARLEGEMDPLVLLAQDALVIIRVAEEDE